MVSSRWGKGLSLAKSGDFARGKKFRARPQSEGGRTFFFPRARSSFQWRHDCSRTAKVWPGRFVFSPRAGVGIRLRHGEISLLPGGPAARRPGQAHRLRLRLRLWRTF